jgi:SAM-dependent methyltransferase
MVGPQGRVIGLDIQPGMVKRLRKRAAKADLANRIDVRLCPKTSLGLEDVAGATDLAVLFAVVHEVPDQAKLFAEIVTALKPLGTVLFAEPAGHVKPESFARSLEVAQRCGLTVVETSNIARSHAAVLQKS